jgi:uncharacterized protein YbcI
MTGHTSDEIRGDGVLSKVSNGLVSLHKEQFGRGPTRARSNFAGRDTLVCTLEDALLPAERMMVELGDEQRVREARGAMQAATAEKFVRVVEDLVQRKVTAFSSAVDPAKDVVWEIFNLEPLAHGDRDATGGATPEQSDGQPTPAT